MAVGIRSGRGWCWLAVGLLSFGLTRPAAAQTRADGDECRETPSSSHTDFAKGAFRAGQVAFSEGAYGRAVQLWGQAYQEDCTAHALLLNLAMAQELLGRPDDAVTALRLFNRRAPDSPYVEANLKRIQSLERAAAERARLRARQARALEAQLTPRVVEPARETSGVPVPLVVAVTGGVVALTGGVLYAEARYSAGQASEGCGASATACSSLESVVDGERARARAEMAGWLTGAGLLATAGGIVWQLLLDEPTLDTRASFRSAEGWQPVIATTEASVRWSGSF